MTDVMIYACVPCSDARPCCVVKPYVVAVPVVNLENFIFDQFVQRGSKNACARASYSRKVFLKALPLH